MKNSTKRTILLIGMVINFVGLMAYWIFDPPIHTWVALLSWVAFVFSCLSYQKAIAYQKGWSDAAKRMHYINLTNEKFSPTCRDTANLLLEESEDM